MDFSWREPWLHQDQLVEAGTWAVGETPLPRALDQGQGTTCIPHALHAMMVAQMRIIAKRDGLPCPPMLSLDHALEMYYEIGYCAGNAGKMIKKLQVDGIVAQVDFENRNNPAVQTYYLDDEIEYEEGIEPLNDLPETIADIKSQLVEVPLLGLVKLHRSWNRVTLLYRPSGKRLCTPGGGTSTHAVLLTRWGRSSVVGENNTKIWEFLNSSGLGFGRDGGFGEVVQTEVLSSVFLARVKPWKKPVTIIDGYIVYTRKKKRC